MNQKEETRFSHFMETHHPRSGTWNNRPVPYYISGKGPLTILTFGGGHSTLDYAYDMILEMECMARVVVVDISLFPDLDDFSSVVNKILDQEKINRVFVLGWSATGIHAQAYLFRNPDRTQGIILVNTLAARAERCRSWALPLIRCIPIRLFISMFRKKMMQMSALEAPVPPEIEARIAYKMKMFADNLQNRVSRDSLLNLMKAAFQFNRQGYEYGDWRKWPGRTLIVTSRDDPEYPDVELLRSRLPHAEVIQLSSGYRHLAPAVERERFYGLIREFIHKKSKA